MIFHLTSPVSLFSLLYFINSDLGTRGKLNWKKNLVFFEIYLLIKFVVISLLFFGI